VDLDQLNRLGPEEARRAFTDCCASDAWADAMTDRRPFTDETALLDAAREIWRALDPSAWDEAFDAHPRIGESRQGDDRHDAWSRHEQEEAGRGPTEVLDRLAERNREYEARFGRVCLVFATGKSAEDLLRLCEDRLGNDPATELAIAAAEQEKITDLRLRRLVGID
jgi:2-oxo-4-hydroxy-4-carboxy-5-ureidoimidazoline decarboxylase